MRLPIRYSPAHPYLTTRFNIRTPLLFDGACVSRPRYARGLGRRDLDSRSKPTPVHIR